MKKLKEEVESKEKKLLDIDDNTVLLMNPVKNRAITMTLKGLDALLELKANVYISGGSRKEKRLYARMNMYVYPKVKTDSFKVQNFWIQELENTEELTIQNFYDLVQPITSNQYEKVVKKWNLMDFIENSLRFTDKDRSHTVDVVWTLLDKGIAEKNGIDKKKLQDIANSIKKTASMRK